jgi:amidase
VSLNEREDICYTSAVELRAMLASRALSARELVETVLSRVDEVDASVNAIVATRPEAALEEAERADEAAERGLLHGIPLTIKDLTETRDLPTTYGSRAFAGHQAGFEALVVTRLREAGAIVIGKTNTSEFGLRPTTENSLFGATSNPWLAGYNSGGSSGGAAAGTAAGMSPLALGSDGGGSCRIPASCCAVVGLKPTRGRVPLAPAAYEEWGGFVANGPIARTVRDVALMLDVIAGPVVGEPYGVAPPAGSFLDLCGRPPAGLRIGYVADIPGVALDDEIRAAFADALKTLESLGHELVETDPGLGGLRDAYHTITQANTAAMLKSFIPDESLGMLEANTLAIGRRGFAWSAADYCLALDFVRTEAARIMGFWTDIDVLATPTLTKLPPANGLVPSIADFDERWRFCIDWHAFTYPFNITGQPAISVPAGRSETDLPIGLQLVGRTGEDATLLALAAAFEEAQPWADRRPELPPRAATT